MYYSINKRKKQRYKRALFQISRVMYSKLSGVISNKYESIITKFRRSVNGKVFHSKGIIEEKVIYLSKITNTSS